MMTQILYYSGLIIAGMTLLYFALDIAIWTLYWMVNII